jgi:hypothetical protein
MAERVAQFMRYRQLEQGRACQSECAEELTASVGCCREQIAFHDRGAMVDKCEFRGLRRAIWTILDCNALVPRSEYENPLTQLLDWVAQKPVMQRFDVIDAGPMGVVLRAEELDGSGKSVFGFARQAEPERPSVIGHALLQRQRVQR